MTEERRAARGRPPPRKAGLPIVEDNPYGDLWFDSAPPLPLDGRGSPKAASTWARSRRCWRRACAWASWWRRRRSTRSCCRPSRRPTCTRPSFNQRMVHEVIRRTASCPPRADHPGPLQAPVRGRWWRRCTAQMKGLPRSSSPAGRRHVPVGAAARGHRYRGAAAEGGRARRGLRAGAPFMPARRIQRTLRLSFVTASVDEIDTAIAALAEVVREQLAHHTSGRGAAAAGGQPA